MNPLALQLLEDGGSAAPLPAAAQRQRYPVRTAPNPAVKRRRNPDLLRVLGENMETDLIPASAVEIDVVSRTSSGMSGMQEIINTPEKPVDPYSQGERALLPDSALVAPDVTPNATKPMDASRMPGATAQSFRSSEAAPLPQAPRPTQPVSQARPVNPMDVLLGKPGADGLPENPSPGASPAAVPPQGMTTESAAAFVASMTPGGGMGDPVQQGVVQEPPAPPRPINEAVELTRRFFPAPGR